MLLADPYARKKSRSPSKNRVWNFFDPSKSFAGDLSSKTQCSQWEKPESATTTASEHSYFALYEAYGTRPYEWGDDPDRQKANTKEEETDLGLLNEGMRYRDLETGTFTTRDPIGYADGPNIYCYVHCNPITKFDAFGLEMKFVNADGSPNDWASGMWNDTKGSLSVDMVNEMDSADTMTVVFVVDNHKDVEVGQYSEETTYQIIDKTDLLAAEEGTPMTTASLFLHEAVEGYGAQNEGLKYPEAHKQASATEGLVTGWTRAESTLWTPICDDNGERTGGKQMKTNYHREIDGGIQDATVTVTSDPKGNISYSTIYHEVLKPPVEESAEE
ncbi:MAG: RHS repeat-associated core domain-containing protein [Kiritimatiellales bacterium]|nr:RHS repeat-associated core domain-containing protein [Kiritimatiellales bacterium]